MMAITDDVVVPFGHNENGELVPLEPVEAPNTEAARRRAQAASTKHGGAIAFSRTGDPNSGDALILVAYGEVDPRMLRA